MHVRKIEPIIKVQAIKKKVCAYVRVSTEHERQNDSLENQMQYYESFIINNPEYEYVGVFSDKGITGFSDKRPGFQQMLKLCREKKIDLIITKSISRFARNTTIMLEVVRELKALGVAILFEKENINTLFEDGEFMLTILSSFAQEESKNVSDNLKWRARKKFQQGELIINTNRFLGYSKDRYGDLIIDQKEARLVKKIYKDYLKGKGVDTIAKELNMNGVPTVGNKQWHGKTILGILRNEKYKGDAILQKYYTPENLKRQSIRNDGLVDSYYVQENHSPIVTPEMWEQVQTEIERRAKAKGNFEGGRSRYGNRYPLTGMLYCSKCGAVLKRRTWNSKNSSRKIVWQCSNYIKNGKSSCNGISVEDSIVSQLNIIEETIVEEVITDGKKCYSYTSKEGSGEFNGKSIQKKKENGCILQSFNGPIGATI